MPWHNVKKQTLTGVSFYFFISIARKGSTARRVAFSSPYNDEISFPTARLAENLSWSNPLSFGCAVYKAYIDIQCNLLSWSFYIFCSQLSLTHNMKTTPTLQNMLKTLNRKHISSAWCILWHNLMIWKRQQVFVILKRKLSFLQTESEFLKWKIRPCCRKKDRNKQI